MSPSRAASLLVLVLSALVAETLRVSFPLLYGFAEDIGFLTAAGVIPLLFAATVLTAPLGRVLGARGLLTGAVAAAAAARLVMQAQAAPGLVATMLALLLGMTGLALALRVTVARAGATVASAALLTGLALDTAVRLLLVTWDAAWQPGPVGWVVATVLVAAVLAALVPVTREPLGWDGDSVRLGLVPGPVLALATLALVNPPFVASAAGVGLAAAGAVTLGGLAVAVAAGRLADNPWVCRAAAVVLPLTLVLVTGPSGLGGVPALLLTPLATVAAGVLLVAALRRGGVVGHRGASGHGPESRRDAATTPATTPATTAATTAVPTAWRTALGAGGGAVALVLVLMPYQISYDLDLLRPVPAPLWPALGGVVLSVLALLGRGARPTEAGGRHTAAVGGVRPVTAAGGVRPVTAAGGVLALLVAPAWLALTAPEVPAEGGSELRVMTFNIHSAVDWHGRLDPEQVARVVQEQGAQVVLLQEVSRGWPIGGGLDSVSWLARRLGMTYVYGPAADGQFGNAVLADRQVLEHWSGRMDRGEGPMHRGYVGAELPAGETTLRVWSTHLQHRDDTTRTRQEQARRVLAAWGGAERSVIGGDLNSRPGSPDLQPWFDGTGLVSAQDVAGDPAWNTSPALDPDHRIDWLLATPDLGLLEAAVPQTLASDHLPVVVTVVVE